MKGKLEEKIRDFTEALATKLIITGAILIVEGLVISMYFGNKVGEFYRRMMARRKEYRRV